MEKGQNRGKPLKENFEKGQTKPPRLTNPPPDPKPTKPQEKDTPPKK